MVIDIEIKAAIRGNYRLRMTANGLDKPDQETATRAAPEVCLHACASLRGMSR
jgi:hypothetical protein